MDEFRGGGVRQGADRRISTSELNEGVSISSKKIDIIIITEFETADTEQSNYMPTEVKREQSVV